MLGWLWLCSKGPHSPKGSKQRGCARIEASEGKEERLEGGKRDEGDGV